MTDLVSRLADIQRRIADACERAERDPASVTLVSVSKGHPLSALREAYELGVRDFGESYVQEWQSKVDEMPDDVRWHFIGHLQSNKVRFIADRVHLVQSVDRKSVMSQLQKRCSTDCEVLLQVNVGADPAKSGAAVDEARPLLETALGFDRLRICGLMTIPPLNDDPEATRMHFRHLRRTFERLRTFLADEHPGRLADFEHLSMGMSGDFELAIEEGATIVRVGTALFGPRSYE